MHATPVAAPTGLGATAGNASASLSWNTSAGATGYRVYRGTSSGGEASTPVGSPSGTTFNDSGLTNGNTYFYKVDATNSTGASPKSSETSATLAPPAPAGLTATASDGSVALSWSTANGATSYRIYRGTSPNGENATAIASPTGTTFTDTGRTNGQIYYY